MRLVSPGLEQALILGKTTTIPLSIAFNLDYLDLLVCFCTATWQYDTFTFWLETYLPKHPVGKQKNDSIATKEQQPLLQKPAKKMEGKTQRKENKKEKKAKK